jgi:hypothetical protein
MRISNENAPGRGWPGYARSVADERRWTAAELEVLTPDQRAALLQERVVTDLSEADPALVDWAREYAKQLPEVQRALRTSQ